MQILYYTARALYDIQPLLMLDASGTHLDNRAQVCWLVESGAPVWLNGKNSHVCLGARTMPHQFLVPALAPPRRLGFAGPLFPFDFGFSSFPSMYLSNSSILRGSRPPTR